MFNQLARQYIQKLIRIRKMLLKSNLNRRDQVYLRQIVTNLDKYLLAFNYSNYQFAGFWEKHHHEIAELIPGEGSKSHNKLLNEFKKLDCQARELRIQNAEFRMQNI